jgi:hypothetical protein
MLLEKKTPTNFKRLEKIYTDTKIALDSIPKNLRDTRKKYNLSQYY